MDDLKNNIKQMQQIIYEMNSLYSYSSFGGVAEKEMVDVSLRAYKNQLKILSKSIPLLLDVHSPVKKIIDIEKKPKNITKVGCSSSVVKSKNFVAISKKDKEKFMKELRISESVLARLKKKTVKNKKVVLNKPNQMAVISSKFFSGISRKLAGNFGGLKDDLKKANIHFAVSVYLSIAFFVSAMVFAGSFVFVGILIFVNFDFIFFIFAPFILLCLSLMFFYFYPSIEKTNINKRISNELPFATIYMSAIAGSNIEPTAIFRIIAKSAEYKAIGIEIKKVLALVDIYGYDIVTSLKKMGKIASNIKLKELLSGIATNIISGGSLKNYLSKKSENLLVDYKLERKKYSKLAETFMDVYISILVTAPLILVMLFVIMDSVGMGLGVSLETLLFFSIGGIVVANVVFLMVLQAKQPKV